MIQTQVRGLKETVKFVRNLQPSIKKEVGEKGTLELAKNLQKRMKRRAPVASGWLRKSIMVEKGKQSAKVVIYAIYAKAIEEGSTPRVIPLAYLEQHMRSPSSGPGKYVQNARRWVYITGRAQPFIEPSIKSFRKNIPNILQKHLKQAIKKSRG